MRFRCPGPGTRSPSTGRTRRSSKRRCSARRWASTRSGRSSTTSSRSTRTARTRRCCTGRSLRARERMRLGYGVRLTPKPYNHPVRSAESAAVLDLISDGRVEFGTGRSSTRAELEGFGIHPERDPGDVAGGDRPHRRLLDQRRVRVQRQALVDAEAAGPAQAAAEAAPADLGRHRKPRDHKLVGQMGIGLLSFAVGTPPEELKKRIDVYREGIAECTKPAGKFINNQAAKLHDGERRADHRRIHCHRKGIVRVVPQARRPHHRFSRAMAGGGAAGTRLRSSTWKRAPAGSRRAWSTC